MVIRLLAFAALLFAVPAHAVVNIDWVTVGNPGNTADGTTYGAVSSAYRIGKYEVTNAQYTEFLNAVAGTDPNGLYNTSMGSGTGGITRSVGPPPNFPYTYSVISGRGPKPVNYVSFWDAARFANWLQNGQPTGGQGNSTTEDGSYTITPAGIAANSITRNTSVATFFVTSEDEWYKAAYYKGGGTNAGYWDYPAKLDTQTTCASPGATTNTANCDSVVGDLTDVGDYTGAASPYQTFDQGGNVWEWNEAIISGSNRGLRGGAFIFFASDLAASVRSSLNAVLEVEDVGFRVASPVPPPPVPALGTIGLLCVAAGLFGFGAYYRRRA